MCLPPTRVATVTVLLGSCLLAVGGCQRGDRADDSTLVVALGGDPGHLNPAITTSGGVHTASELMYDGLVALDDDLNPLPRLAVRWEVLEGGRRVRFNLRPGVSWHDGEPFTAVDVKYSVEEVLTRFHARTRASLGSVLDSVQIEDPLTVVFWLADPYAALLSQLDYTEAPLLPAHLYAGTDPLTNDTNFAPVGTGPFRFESYVPGQGIELLANPTYFLGQPAIKRVVMRVIPEPGAQVLALEAGEVDWLFGVPGPDRRRLTSNPDLGFLETTRTGGGSNCIMSVVFNLDRPSLADVRTRRAIARGVDRGQFVDRVLFGGGRVADAPISAGIAYAHRDDLDIPSFSRTAAQATLDSVGWVRGPDGVRTASGVSGVPDGQRLVIDFVHFPTFRDYADLFRGQLSEIGVEVRPRPMEPAVAVEVIFTERDFDTAIISYCNGPDPEIGLRRMYDTQSIGPVPFSNAAAYRNPAIDSLFDRARASGSRPERAELYFEIQERVVRDLPYLWLVEPVATRAFRRRCSGFGADGHFAAPARCGP